MILFVAASGLVGPKIISSGLINKYGFEIYGGLGKAAIFGLIVLALLIRHSKAQVVLRRWRPGMVSWLLAAAAAFTFAWVCIDSLLAGSQKLQDIVGVHAGLLTGVAFTAFGCIGLKNIHRLWRQYKPSILVALAITASFYVFLQVVYGLWQPLAKVVLLGVSGLLELTRIPVATIEPYTLVLDKFGITIAQYCSGIESIALFSGLYIIVGLLDWPRIRRRRYYALFPVALLILFGLNIVRVYGLIVAGYFINPELAFSLFHTYAGMVFFILYSAVFWAIAYKYILNTQKTKHEDSASH